MAKHNKRSFRHKGRLHQIPIYLGKFFRMFLYMDDWKVIPMAAIIAGLVAFCTGKNMFLTMEATLKGSLALTCVCVWNGFFNSIQVVCRERDIIKREHRNGMHVTSYVIAHMIYQAFLCLLQTCVSVFVCVQAGIHFPETGLAFSSSYIEIGVTFFLITFSADMMSLMISCMVKNTTMAMTVMPFALIFELLFSGTMFSLQGFADKLTHLSIAKWGIRSLCIQGNFNSLESTMAWTQLKKMQGIEYMGTTPVKDFITYTQEANKVSEFNHYIGSQSTIADYNYNISNLFNCWGNLLLFALIFAFIAILFLKLIDNDKR